MKKVIVCMMLITISLSVFATGASESNDVQMTGEGHGETELVVYSTIFAEYAEAMKKGSKQNTQE